MRGERETKRKKLGLNKNPSGSPMDRREEEAEDKEISIQSKEDESCRKFLVMIPIDLIHEILLRLHAKSVAKFRCVSKLWSSITTRPDFIRSFASQSSTRMCLLACVKTRDKRLSCSLPQAHNMKIRPDHPILMWRVIGKMLQNLIITNGTPNRSMA